MITQPRITDAHAEWSPDVLRELVDDLGSFWRQRATIVRSGDTQALALARLDERIRAAADALALAGRYAWLVLDEALAEGSESMAQAGALPLAIQDTDRTRERILKAFDTTPEARAGITEALQHHAGPKLREWFVHKAKAERAEAALIAWSTSDWKPDRGAVDGWLTHAEPGARRAAWQLLALDAQTGSTARLDLVPIESDFARGLADPDATVGEACLQAAIWRHAKFLLPRCREALTTRTPWTALAAWTLAALGEADDLALVVAARPTLGDALWTDCLAAAGRPALVPQLLDQMNGRDEVAAAFAGRAFRRITGLDAETSRRISVPPPGSLPADPDPDFSDELPAADPAVAAALWAGVEADLRKAARLRGGRDIATIDPAAWPAELDLEARHDAYLRAAWTGRWKGVPFDLMRLTGTGPWACPV